MGKKLLFNDTLAFFQQFTVIFFDTNLKIFLYVFEFIKKNSDLTNKLCFGFFLQESFQLDGFHDLITPDYS